MKRTALVDLGELMNLDAREATLRQPGRQFL